MDLNYQLGIYVGQYIFFKYLPTLSTDMLKTRNVIHVNEDELIEHTTIDLELTQSYTVFGGNGNSDDFFKRYKSFNNKLAEKYLPHELVCACPKFSLTDIDEFKNGLREMLWDTDLCWYGIATNDDVEIVDYYGQTIITLKLRLE